MSLQKPLAAYVDGVEVPVSWLARRRWARAGLLYAALLFFGVLFMGPLLVAALSSLKTDPVEYPPRLVFEEVSPRNWLASWGLGLAGAGNPWLGGFAPGAKIFFSATYLVPEKILPSQTKPANLLVNIPRLRPGAGAQVLGENFDYPADYARIENLRVSSVVAASMSDGASASRVNYSFFITYPKNQKNVNNPSAPLPIIKRVPMSLEAERGYVFQTATLSPSRLELPQVPTKDLPYAYPKIQSYINVAPGFLTYVFRNYFRIFEESRSQTTGRPLFLSWLVNSFGLVLIKVLSTLVLASMAGYALARLPFFGKSIFFVFVLFVMTVPNQVMFISNYLVLRDLKLLNNIFGVWLVMPFIAAGQVFLMKQFFETLPRELEEAAKIDGASPNQTFWRVIMPLAAPALGALTITTAQGAWNEYFWALIVLTNPQDIFTLPIGLNTFNKFYGNTGDYGLILAGAIVSALPVIVLFVVFQRYFVSSAAFSGGKE